MQFCTVRDLRINTALVWQDLEKQKDLIITSNGRPIALLTGISGDTLEDMLFAVRAARGRLALKGMHEHARAKGLDKIRQKDIDKIIARTRRQKHK